MEKKEHKAISHDAQKTWIVKKVAGMYKVSERFVYMVINGEKDNEAIFNSYMDILQGSNDLVKAVEELVPFNPKQTTAA